MFKFLKRLAVPEPSRPAPARKAAAKPRAAEARPEPAVLPEITEGNDQTDWALWEDSVAALDSQMQSLSPSARIYGKPETPSDYQDIDAFSRVTRKDA
jgi:hypothetical protein